MNVAFDAVGDDAQRRCPESLVADVDTKAGCQVRGGSFAGAGEQFNIIRDEGLPALLVNCV